MSELNIEAEREAFEWAMTGEWDFTKDGLGSYGDADTGLAFIGWLAARRAPVSTPQQSAQRASVDTLSAIADSIECDGLVRTAAKLREEIAHINAWGSAGSGATNRLKSDEVKNG